MRYLMIRTEDLSKQYGQRLGVNELTFEVEPGEIFGFLGPDGAGKTTTVRLLLDFIRPSSGRALVLGMDLHENSLKIRRQVGYLPGEISLYHNTTGEKLLRYLARLRGGVAWEYVLELAARLDVDLSRPVDAMSALERRKIGLAQAFMHRPELLVFDEPTRGLDAPTQQAFYRLMIEARNEGCAIFLASSSLSEMERTCDRVGILYRGELAAVERGVHLRSRAMRHIEMRFANPVSAETFSRLPNLENLQQRENQISCTVHGDPDALIKLASQFRVTDFISQIPTLEEAFRCYYGVNAHAG